jgi:hypothetical protein
MRGNAERMVAMAWEYLVHTLDSIEAFSSGEIRPREMQDVLDRHGKEGWDLVSAFETEAGLSAMVVLTSKRPVSSDVAATTRHR